MLIITEILLKILSRRKRVVFDINTAVNIIPQIKLNTIAFRDILQFLGSIYSVAYIYHYQLLPFICLLKSIVRLINFILAPSPVFHFDTPLILSGKTTSNLITLYLFFFARYNA